MASPASTALRAELTTNIRDLDPSIRGLEDMVNDKLSEDLRAVLNAELERLRERRSDEAAVLATLDTLEGHGYPALAELELPQHLFDELQRELADGRAGGGRFKMIPPVDGGTMTIPPFEDVQP